MTEIIKKIGEKLAAHGFRVLIPDLYKGKLGLDAEEASHVGASAIITTAQPAVCPTSGSPQLLCDAFHCV